MRSSHYRTSLYSEVERALRCGAREIVVKVRGASGSTRTLVLMHLVAGRWYYFDARENPELQYGGTRRGARVERDADLPDRRREAHGLCSLEQHALQQLFFAGRAQALVPRAARYALAAR